jgi:hypothetical protein
LNSIGSSNKISFSMASFHGGEIRIGKSTTHSDC